MADFISIACLFFNQLTLKLKNSRIHMTNDLLEIFLCITRLEIQKMITKYFFCNVTITTVLLESLLLLSFAYFKMHEDLPFFFLCYKEFGVSQNAEQSQPISEKKKPKRPGNIL